MPSLKDLRVRIRSVQSTQKITAAMKVVAASRLRRAQQQAEAARPYAQRMERVLSSLAARMTGLPTAPPLLVGTGKDETHLIIVATSDRGLAGGFNASILRETRRRVRELETAGKRVMILTIGRKGRDGLRRDYGRMIHDSLTEIGRRHLSFDEARDIAERILVLFRTGSFDVCTVIYNRFRSAITQIVTAQQLIPFPIEAEDEVGGRFSGDGRGLRIRALGRGDPRRIIAAESRGADLYCTARKRGERAGCTDDGDGQCHPQCRRYDRPTHHELQSHPSGRHHQGTDRDHLRSRVVTSSMTGGD